MQEGSPTYVFLRTKLIAQGCYGKRVRLHRASAQVFRSFPRRRVVPRFGLIVLLVLLIVVRLQLHRQKIHAISYTHSQPGPENAEEEGVANNKADEDEIVELTHILLNDSLNFLREWAIFVDFLSDHDHNVPLLEALILLSLSL